MSEIIKTLVEHPFMMVCTFIFIASMVKFTFNFIVELIHGKPNVINLPAGSKIVKQEKQNEGDVIKEFEKTKVDVGQVSVKARGK